MAEKRSSLAGDATLKTVPSERRRPTYTLLAIAGIAIGTAVLLHELRQYDAFQAQTDSKAYFTSIALRAIIGICIASALWKRQREFRESRFWSLTTLLYATGMTACIVVTGLVIDFILNRYW